MKTENFWQHPDTDFIRGDYDEALDYWEVYLFDQIKYEWTLKSLFPSKADMIEWYELPENYLPLIRNSGGE